MVVPHGPALGWLVGGPQSFAAQQLDGPSGLVVGGWVRGDKRLDVAPLLGPLTDAGFAWFSIEYRLTTDWTRFGGTTSFRPGA